ncbi:hypothetical protein M0805_005523 [Coniferiporia weirii]|nr:hypothetical protein M0805_005523 [Coniferiporia weirii]
MSGRPAPQRSDSLRNAAEDALLAALHDEMHDMRRVRAYGEENDLKEALGRTIARVEELSTLLTQAHKTQAELETNLKLARSNLQLALANNEMLEEALKRESVLGSKDIGWRRRSDRPDSRQGFHKEPASSSVDSPPSSRRGSASAVPTPTSDPPSTPSSPIPKPPTSPPPPVVQDTRFFRFRFGSSSPSTSPNPGTSTARARTPPLHKSGLDASHLTSASLPSLVAIASKREEELVAELEAERAKYLKVSTEKSTLEQEIESLSQALFEEANKMVAHERIKCAEIIEELRQVRQEKEAMKSAMRVIEQENMRLKSPVLPSAAAIDDTTPRESRPGSRTGVVRSFVAMRSPSPGAGTSEAGSSSRGRTRSRSASPSSTHGCRGKSSSSERGWASPEPEFEAEAEVGGGAGAGADEKQKEEASEFELHERGEARHGLGPFSPPPSMPVEESPWAR